MHRQSCGKLELMRKIIKDSFLHFDDVGENSSSSEKEFWTPLKKQPSLTQKEVASLFLKDGLINELHIAHPTCFHSNDSSFSHTPISSIRERFLIATLNLSPYLLLFNSFESSKFKSKESDGGKESYYIDHFYEPSFGGLNFKYYLFEKTELDSLPQSIIIMKETKRES